MGFASCGVSACYSAPYLGTLDLDFTGYCTSDHELWPLRWMDAADAFETVALLLLSPEHVCSQFKLMSALSDFTVCHAIRN